MANNATNLISRFNLPRVMLCAAVLTIAFAPAARPDDWDKKTVVTTNVPIEVPGKALPAGTYVFKLLDSPSNRNIVQIFDKDEKHLLATALTVPDYRLEPADKPLLQFAERPSGTPEALKAWFYPGENYGREFVYPHQRAVRACEANTTECPVDARRNDPEHEDQFVVRDFAGHSGAPKDRGDRSEPGRRAGRHRSRRVVETQAIS